MSTPLRTEFNAFLFSPIANDPNGMHLTLLSALARSGVDPWAEAAELAALSRDSATQKLVSLLGRVPNGPPPGDAIETRAARLVALLHAPVKPKQAPTESGALRPPVAAGLPRKNGRLAIYFLMAVGIAILASWAMHSRAAPASAETGALTSL